MSQNNIHLVPQAILDSGDNVLNSKLTHMRLTHIQRLQAVKEYCDYVLKKAGIADEKIK